MSGNEDHHRQGRRFAAEGNGHDGRDPRDVEIERLQSPTGATKKMVPTRVLVEIAFTITVDPPTEAMKKMVPTRVLVEIAFTITVDPPTEATRRWIVT
nr:reverse transcriptase domain-containing protein [Tanacetum cinerariifolium]